MLYECYIMCSGFNSSPELIFRLVSSMLSSLPRRDRLMSITDGLRAALFSERPFTTLLPGCIDVGTSWELGASPFSMCDLFEATRTMMNVG